MANSLLNAANTNRICLFKAILGTCKSGELRWNCFFTDCNTGITEAFKADSFKEKINLGMTNPISLNWTLLKRIQVLAHTETIKDSHTSSLQYEQRKTMSFPHI